MTATRQVGLAVLIAMAFLAPAAASAQTWTLVWSDEANGSLNTLPDGSKWVYDNPTAGASNQEWQIYCGQAGAGQSGNCANWAQNAHYDGAGNLRITATLVNGQWTSARLLTASKYTPTYGRIEARIRLPFAPGLWPAFWLLGNNIGSVGWPTCGEMDIMESVPSLGASRIRSSLHSSAYSGGNSVSGDYVFPSGGRVDTAYHVYGMVWSQNRVDYSVDGNTFASFTPSNVPGGVWPFNAPFFMIVNLAVGGTWPGPPDATTPNPARMYIDYVRVYQASAATPTPTPTATPAPSATPGATPTSGGGAIANGTYRLIARHSGKALDVANSATADGSNVHQWTYFGLSNQLWTVTSLGGGQYQIQSQSAAKALDVAGAGTADGTNVQIWTWGGGNNQRWTITATDGGYYRVSPVHAPALALDVSGPSTADGANVHVWTYGGGTNQQWAFLAP